jgi:hypothetical protein
MNNERTFSLSIDGFCGLGHDGMALTYLPSSEP